MRPSLGLNALLTVVLLSGCDCGPGEGTPTPDGGRGTDGGGAGGSTDAGTPCTDLVAIVRDFHKTHPDFESFNGTAEKGLVQSALGADHKPVHAAPGPTTQTTGPANFAQWYNDVPGVNQRFTVPLPLTPAAGGTFIFDSAAFFPLDGKGFGEEGNPHNFHFTTELHTSFKYKGGEAFTFRGDDDVWVFVNKKLALDLGGLHQALEGTIRFDELGLTVGQTYPLDVFHAERHTVESNFRIQTSIDCFLVPALN